MSSSKPNEFIILVIGPTGSGKSKFVNDATNSEAMRVVGGLEGGTKKVASTKPFSIDDKTVILIDTPGLNNDESKDVREIFREVETLLQNEHNGKQLRGIIYIHAIDARQVEKSIQSDIKKVRSVASNEPKSSFIVATTMWDAADPDHARRWEEKLKKEDILFKQFADVGVKFVQHPGPDSRNASAQQIIRSLLEGTGTINLNPTAKGKGSRTKPGTYSRSLVQLLRRLFGLLEREPA